MNSKLQNLKNFLRICFSTKLFIIIFSAVLLLSGLAYFLLPESKTNEQFDNNTQYLFNKYINQLFSDQLHSDSLSMHFYLSDPNKFGIKNEVQTLGDFSYEAMVSSQQHYINEINMLKKFEYDKLHTEQQITYDVIMENFKDQLDFADLCLCSQVLSPTTGLQAQLPVLFAEYSFYSKSDIDNYLTLLWQIKDYYARICEFQKIKAERDSFISDFNCEKIIAQCKNFIGDKSPKKNFLHTSFVKKVKNLSFLNSAEKQTYISENIKILQESVFPAYDNLISTLSDLKAKGFCKNNNGLYYLKNGKEYYEYLTKNYTGSSKSVSELKSDIQTDLTNDMRTIYSLLSVNPELEEKFYSDMSHSQNAENIISDLLTKACHDFPVECGGNNLSDISYKLKYVDKSLEDFLSPAFYFSPPIDTPSQNIIYINNSERLQNQNIYSTLAHEGIPGHMYQSWFFSSTNPHPVRHLISSGGYTEGWATYVEFMSYYYQYSDEKLANAFSCSASYSLALYSLCDIGVNYEGWTLKDTKKFLSNYNIDSEKVCESIFQSVIEEPANYLKYYVGYMEIRTLKENLENKLGSSFDLKRFHKAFLSIGPAPFNVVEKWIMYEYAK